MIISSRTATSPPPRPAPAETAPPAPPARTQDSLQLSPESQTEEAPGPIDQPSSDDAWSLPALLDPTEWLKAGIRFGRSLAAPPK